MERIKVDLETLDVSYPVKTKHEIMPDGLEIDMPIWDKERLNCLIALLDEGAWESKEIVYTGLPPCWAIAAADHKCRPDMSYHVTRYLDDAQMPLRRLPIGEENPHCEISIETIEDGDKLYMWIGADDPALKYHHYDAKKFEHAVAPVIPEGKHLYLVANAATFILLCYEKTYAPICKSVSVSFFHDRVNDDMKGQRLFTCCYTTCDEVELGDRHPVPFELDKG